VVRIVNALAADVPAFGNAGAAFLHHFADQAVLQRFAGLDPAAEQVPVPLAVIIAGAQEDHPGCHIMPRCMNTRTPPGFSGADGEGWARR
jgi:hypothetical protein